MAKDTAQRMREMRNRQKLEGRKDLRVMLPADYKGYFDKFRTRLHATSAETICYLLDVAMKRNLDSHGTDSQEDLVFVCGEKGVTNLNDRSI